LLLLDVTPRGYPVAGLNGQELIESFRKWTEPSAKAKFAPPGWKLDGPSTQEISYWSLKRGPS
jgi:hypothetical protein